jgi:hypothetical protein
MENLVGGKTVKVTLVGTDGNSFALMGRWKTAARQQGWTKEEIDKVLGACMSGDRDNLLAVLFVHSEDNMDLSDEEEDPDEYEDYHRREE